ncbi:MAG: prepilin-type N-terminal cleavage/methylation domain-containing protein [Planctomycetes bacterium]|nr:prepilin-type N-terminal cleavage/methylation domain-containing protein [Planctomycetota bacterium]
MIKKGFSLVELMIAVLILGTLMAIAIPRISGGAYTAGVNACRKNVDIMNSQIELYYSRTGKWPVDLGVVTKDPNSFPDGPPECPFRTPYILVTTNGKNRVPEHKHLDRKEVKVISDRILNRN